MFGKSSPKLVCKECGYVGDNFFKRKVYHYSAVGKIGGTYYRCPECGGNDIILYEGALEEIISEHFGKEN